MAKAETIKKVKSALRIHHSKLDSEIGDDIDECLADLTTTAGVIYPDEADPLILAAIKNHARSNFIDKTDKSAEYLRRYEGQKASLTMASGYGGDSHGRK